MSNIYLYYIVAVNLFQIISNNYINHLITLHTAVIKQPIEEYVIDGKISIRDDPIDVANNNDHTVF